MILASYQLSNAWHGLGHVGHVVLAVIFVCVLAGILIAFMRRR